MGPFVVIIGYVVGLLAALIGLALMAFAVAVHRTEWKFRGIPGPKRESFFFGNISRIVGLKEKFGIPTALIIGIFARDYGKVFWIRTFWQGHVFVSAPEITKELLLKSQHAKYQNLYRVMQSLFGARFMGHGLVSEVNHEQWFHRRAIMNPAFRRKYLMGMMEQFNESSNIFCQQLLIKADGKTEVAMAEEFNNVTLDVIAKIAFSMNTEATTNPDCPFPSAVATSLRGMQMILDKPWLALDPRSETRKRRQEVREAVNLVRETGQRWVKERIEARRKGDHVPSDILNLILDSVNDLQGDENFGMEQMIDEFVTLFVAGQETTANLLAFTIQQLGRNPEVAKKVQAEVDDVLGQKPVIEYEDLAKLEYMMRVFKETMRLYPPVLGTSRVSGCPIKYKDITIPANAAVHVMSIVASRMEEYFDDPLLFIPDRFKTTDDGTLPRHLYAYFPFSMGQRSCIGQHFAMIEARVILSKLLQRFEFRLNQGQRVSMKAELTLKPVDGCKNYVTVRS